MPLPPILRAPSPSSLLPDLGADFDFDLDLRTFVPSRPLRPRRTPPSFFRAHISGGHRHSFPRRKTSSTASSGPPLIVDSKLSFKTNGAAAKSFPRVDLTNSTMLRVDFPEGSINPGNKSLPTGGIGLYATPLDLSSATNVTFSYSVFFPEDFDFVKGGKLPGLYGGHEGCSGGAESEDCFSTRTMFRKDGMGELYLYAPRDAQPAALCETPPLTYCDTKYGMSIGRGAWTFARGAWTTVRQNIRLNTPGIADGGIRIYVDDVLVISSDTVLFRKNLTKPKPTSTLPAPAASSSRSPASPPKSTFSPSAAATPSPSRGGGLLDGLLGKLGLSNLLIVDQGSPPATDSAGSMSLSSPSPSTSSATATSADIPIFTRPTPLLPPVFPSALAAAKKAAKESPTSAGLEGVMLHTFFGGSDPSWASPRDQHLYLDRLSLQIIS
ncbi:hypothetical protein JCM6882_003808 [Rhodosporidiobolus microsporus]